MKKHKYMKKIHLVLIALLSGVIMSLGWPAHGIPFLLLVGLVPLLYIEYYIAKNKAQFHNYSVLFYAYIAFFVWNLFTTWWICYSTLFGAIMAVIFNALFMAIVFHIFHISKKIIYKHSPVVETHGHASLLLIFYWLAFEYLHLNWELSWPWLTFGNGFANWHYLIQWYEFTGVLGGSLWILIINILIFKILKFYIENKKSLSKQWANIITALILIFLPIILSLVIYTNYKEEENAVNVVVVQPNNNPYTEQFELSTLEIVKNVLNLTDEKITDETDVVVCPESVLQEGIWEDCLDRVQGFKIIRKYLNKNYPHVTFVIGGTSYKMFEKGEELTSAARKLYDGNYYETYNTTFIIDTSVNIGIYHKSKLVLGVEKMPFVKHIKFIENLALDLGER